MANKVKFGLKNVYIAPLTVSDDGTFSFGAPRHIPGAVSLTMDPKGDTEKFYADNVAYYVSIANDGYEGTLEMALVPDWFQESYLGASLDSTDKVLVEKNDAEASSFALLYQIEGDQKASLRLFYNCTASRISEAAGTTSNSKTPKTDSMTLSAVPLPDGSVKAKTTEETPTSVISSWFQSVWLPAAQAPNPEGNGETT